jgi:hypothetical protein
VNRRSLTARAVATWLLLFPATARTQDEVLVDAAIGKKVWLLEDGQAALVVVVATCAVGHSILETLVYLVQDGFTSQFSHIPLVCDGEPHVAVVRVNALDVPFHKGAARASAYVELTTGESTSPTRIVRLKNVVRGQL